MKNCSISIPVQLTILLCNRKKFQSTVNLELDIYIYIFSLGFMVNANLIGKRKKKKKKKSLLVPKTLMT